MLCRSLILVGIVGLALSLGSAAAQSAKTITVCAEGCDFVSIQAAIDAAEPGYTVAVQPGIYQESLIIPVEKALTLRGAGRDATILVGDGQVPGINIKAQGSSVEGFTITGGGEAGIRVQTLDGFDELVIISDNRISHTAGTDRTDGWGIWVAGAVATIADNEILSNRGGIAAGNAEVTIVNNLITDNVVGIAFGDAGGTVRGNLIARSHLSSEADDEDILSFEGVGLFLITGSPNVLDNFLVDNERDGVVVQSSSGAFRNNHISGNGGWGIRMEGPGSLEIFDNILAGNGGGGLFVEYFGIGDVFTLQRNVFASNDGDGVRLEGLFLFKGKTIELVENILVGNAGCGVRTDGSGQITGRDNTVTANEEGALCPADYAWPPSF
jgi:nitrous oxidase accessory protein NosD